MTLGKVGDNQFSIVPIILILNNILVVVHLHVQEKNLLNGVPFYKKRSPWSMNFDGSKTVDYIPCLRGDPIRYRKRSGN